MFSSPSGLLVTFCIALGAAFAWHSYGDAARQFIASSYPEADWLAPRTAPIAYSASGATQASTSSDQQRLDAISVDLDAMRQIVDRIAVTQELTTRNVDKLTAGVERMMRNVDQLTAGQERMTHEMSKLQAAEQQNRHKNTEPALRPTSAAPRKPAPRSVQASSPSLITPRSPSAPRP
jgi:hypothetical protein